MSISVMHLCLVLATQGIDAVNRCVNPMGYYASLSTNAIGFTLERLNA